MNDRLVDELEAALRPKVHAPEPPGPVLQAAARARAGERSRRFGALGVLALVPVAGLVLVSLGVPLFSGPEAPAPAIASGEEQTGQEGALAEATSLGANPEDPSPASARPHPDSLLALSRGDERPPETASRRSLPEADLSIRAGSLRQLQESGLLGPADTGTEAGTDIQTDPGLDR
ncbi:MAG: hypothetical protein JJU33_06415 [Phycisphaerales bacterium]|nr:hypothetical protein [Phycisphaerales bacterium]